MLGRAPIAYLAVETSRGPHVTPLLFAATPDRLWFAIGRGTLKARVVARRPAVGVLVPGAEASVALRGEATLIDRLSVPRAELARAPLALPAFASRNALEMAAFARDVARREAPPQPPALVSVRVDDVELLEEWPAPAVLGWLAPDGPIALPARWDAAGERARVPAAALNRAGGPRAAAACVCLDESDGRGPLAKRGTLLRGRGRATLRGDVASIALEPERITRWSGFRTETAALG
ncbi:MAG TPA: pyridoxamine 5'-phosphate oxidase family protein [Solirubrobacteraceae bacterium]